MTAVSVGKDAENKKFKQNCEEEFCSETTTWKPKKKYGRKIIN
jgi:hypothetical protein